MAVKLRHFENPFEDYTFASAESVITLNKLNPASKIVTSLPSKWEKTIEKLNQISNSDYTVYTGTAGLALLKLLKDPDDTNTLREVKSLLSLNKLKGRRHSFLCGDAGPLAIGAVVCYKLGEKDESSKLIENLLSMQDPVFEFLSDLPNEYLYGRAGYLFALMYINKHVYPAPIPDEVIRKVVDAILQCGQIEAKASGIKSPLMYQWHNSYYLGAAHGVSGILYLLLQVKEHLKDTELKTVIKPTIDYLASLRFPSGNYPSSLGSDDKYVQWCHGAPGFVFLFSEAYKVFSDKKYLDLAEQAAEVVWHRGLVKKGYSICHGVSGNAYCFLVLYQITQNDKQLYRALKFTEWCIYYTKQHEEHCPDRPLSLYEGIAGPLYLLVDIQEPMQAKFPGFTL